MKFFTTHQLGKKRFRTPEGFLVIQDVPVARIGELVYGPGETPIRPGKDGLVRVTRDEAEVFRAETLASLAGKSVTNDHPAQDVNPRNWKQLTCGVVLNPRRGEGADCDYTVADVLITDAATIRDVEAGKREVSCGYDATYVETGEGLGQQRNIVYNHLALVKRGRCGTRCAFGDHDHQESDMSKRTLFQRIQDALGNNDQAAIERLREEVEAEGDRTDVHVHLPGSAVATADAAGPGDEDDEDGTGEGGEKPADRYSALDARLGSLEEKINQLLARTTDSAGGDAAAAADAARTKLEADLAAEAPPSRADQARKARDSEFLADSHQEATAGAEILAPGIRLPTFDRAADPKATLDSICALRRRALDLAYHQPDTRSIIDDIQSGVTFDLSGMSCEAVRTLFRGAVAGKKALNQQRVAAADRQARDSRRPTKMGTNVQTPAQFNAMIAERERQAEAARAATAPRA